MMVNAITLMNADDLTAVHREIGPFCLEILLNATTPVATTPTPEPAARQPRTRQRRQSDVPKARSDALIARLREAVGDDGWTEDGLREVFTGKGGHQTARALAKADPDYRISQSAANAIEEFLR